MARDRKQIAQLVAAFLLLGSPCISCPEPPASNGAGAPAQQAPQLGGTVLFDEMPDIDLATSVLRPGVERYVIIYQSADPNAFKTGVIDATVVVEAIRKQFGQNLPDYAMLDFEEPFLAVLSKGPTEERFQETVATMANLIRTVKQNFPQTKWCFYGLPGLPYWIGKGQNWVDAPEALRREVLERAFVAFAPISKEMDWFSPSIYAVYDPKFVPYQAPEKTREQGRAWRAAQVLLARKLSEGRPLLPIICPWWGAAGSADYCRVLSKDALAQDILDPALRAGADGFCIWTAANYTINRVTDQDQSKYGPEKNYGTPEWRKAMVSDYLGGVEPVNWQDPKIRATLERGVSQTIAQTIRTAIEQTARVGRSVSGTQR